MYNKLSQLLSQEDIVCVYDFAACNGLIEVNVFPIQGLDGYHICMMYVHEEDKS